MYKCCPRINGRDTLVHKLIVTFVVKRQMEVFNRNASDAMEDFPAHLQSSESNGNSFQMELNAQGVKWCRQDRCIRRHWFGIIVWRRRHLLKEMNLSNISRLLLRNPSILSFALILETNESSVSSFLLSLPQVISRFYYFSPLPYHSRCSVCSYTSTTSRCDKSARRKLRKIKGENIINEISYNRNQFPKARDKSLRKFFEKCEQFRKLMLMCVE